MLQPITKIVFRQQPTVDNPTRSLVLTFDFVHSWEWSESWDKLTQTGKIIIPKKVYARDKYNKLYPLFGPNKNIGGFTANPMILRGDTVTVDSSYYYWDKSLNRLQTAVQRIATGYVSKVHSKQPIELDIEDNMWKLKYLPAPNKVWPASQYTLEAILKEMLQGTPFTVNVLTSTTISFDTTNLTSQNETVAQFLARLRRDYHMYSYFRGNELRCGSEVYLPAEATNTSFYFQDNIIDEGTALDYQRKDDIVLSAVASNHIEDKTGTFNKDGTAKTKKERIEILVTLANDKTTVKNITKGEKPDPNTDGERLTLFCPWAKNIDELQQYAIAELKKMYYEGFRGSFNTFGMPYVKHGDNVSLINPVLPEQNGTYKVRQVDYSGGVSGWRQKIKLHYKQTL